MSQDLKLASWGGAYFGVSWLPPLALAHISLSEEPKQVQCVAEAKGALVRTLGRLLTFNKDHQSTLPPKLESYIPPPEFEFFCPCLLKM